MGGFIIRKLRLQKRSSWKWGELSRFAKQLGKLLQAGLPIMTALELLYRQERNRRWELMQMMARLTEGKGLTDAFQDAGFPPLFLSLMGMAEYHGEIGKSLMQIGDWYERNDRFRRNMIQKLSYPFFLLISSFFLLIFFITVMLPQFEGLFRTFQEEIPPITAFLLFLSRWIRENHLLLLVVLCLLFTGIFLFYKYLRRKGKTISLLLFLPFVGNYLRSLYTLRISSQLGLLLEAGLGIQEGLKAIRSRMGGIEVGATLSLLEQHILDGYPLSTFSSPLPLFTDDFFRLAALGESQGNMGEQLLLYGQFLEEDLARKGETLLRWVEPVTLLILGGIVAFLILALFLPFFQVMQRI